MEFIIFQIIVLLFSVVIHEISHGYVAEMLGDPTARLAGRLTLNPLKHLDPFGSVLLPLLLALMPGGIVFGWAKPVPYNPMNLKRPERDGALIAAAGPLSNLLLALIFSIIFRIAQSIGLLSVSAFGELLITIVAINIALAVFNLIPLPPLDGSKVLFAFLPRSAGAIRMLFEQYGMVLLLVFIFFGISLIHPVILWIFNLFIGV